MERQPQWYKEAIIYQLHVKAFQDSNSDGFGDFRGLTSRLNYLQALGVTALWLLPFYPSPLRDDGYDVSNYCDVHPLYGNLEDVRVFIEEAHKRNLYVITELVINHTSDQHPWFQRARQAPKDSSWRNFYVWSDNDNAYSGTRIIFTDTETSNWTWDPVAQQFYWHRFFSHQPDLNFDHPEVLQEVIDVMRFWLNMGIDGLRLDAVPYLCEREGTTNENIPETHVILQKLRQVIDTEYTNRVFLAEANQWPEDVRPYFGNDNECHMAFHFPLMPRIFLSLANEDRYHLVDILRQTPDIPPKCQWAIFLRNHDELTLEMVTEDERNRMYHVFAEDPRAKLNVGIRRRLAPLLENDRKKIELLISILFSMPGTPILYYGDEIGMGDNLNLTDRNGVRTPMQWSPQKHAGFSEAIDHELYLPLLDDTVYGFQLLNVEYQQKNSASLLNWIIHFIDIRKKYKAFGFGKIELLYPNNRSIFAYIRTDSFETIFCIANLSHAAQFTTIDLSRYHGHVLIDIFSENIFPIITNEEYPFTLPGYSFFWFIITIAPQTGTVPLHISPEYKTLVLPIGCSITDDFVKNFLEHDIFPDFFKRCSWMKEPYPYSIKIEKLLSFDDKLTLCTFITDPQDGTLSKTYRLFLMKQDISEAEKKQNLLPFGIAKQRTAAKEYLLCDAYGDDIFIRNIIRSNLMRFARNVTEDNKQQCIERQQISHGCMHLVIDKRYLVKLYYVIDQDTASSLLNQVNLKTQQEGIADDFRIDQIRITLPDMTEHILGTIEILE